jgi:hypothetical protein
MFNVRRRSHIENTSRFCDAEGKCEAPLKAPKSVLLAIRPFVEVIRGLDGGITPQSNKTKKVPDELRTDQ